MVSSIFSLVEYFIFFVSFILKKKTAAVKYTQCISAEG